jgi:hypothetical protein
MELEKSLIQSRSCITLIDRNNEIAPCSGITSVLFAKMLCICVVLVSMLLDWTPKMAPSYMQR